MFFRRNTNTKPTPNAIITTKVKTWLAREENKQLLFERLSHQHFGIFLSYAFKNMIMVNGTAITAVYAYTQGNSLTFTENDFSHLLNAASAQTLCQFIQHYPQVVGSLIAIPTYVLGVTSNFYIANPIMSLITRGFQYSVLKEAKADVETKNDTLEKLEINNKFLTNDLNYIATKLAGTRLGFSMTLFILMQMTNPELLIDSTTHELNICPDEEAIELASNTIKKMMVMIYLIAFYVFMVEVIDRMFGHQSAKSLQLNQQLEARKTWLNNAIPVRINFQKKQGRFLQNSCFVLTLCENPNFRSEDVINLLKTTFNHHHINVIEDEKNYIVISANFPNHQSAAKKINEEITNGLALLQPVKKSQPPKPKAALNPNAIPNLEIEIQQNPRTKKVKKLKEEDNTITTVKPIAALAPQILTWPSGTYNSAIPNAVHPLELFTNCSIQQGQYWTLFAVTKEDFGEDEQAYDAFEKKSNKLSKSGEGVSLINQTVQTDNRGNLYPANAMIALRQSKWKNITIFAQCEPITTEGEKRNLLVFNAIRKT